MHCINCPGEFPTTFCCKSDNYYYYYFSLKNLQKRLSKHIDVKAVIESSIHPKFCFSQSKILIAITCIAHCVSSDFALGKGLAYTIVCCYPELQELRKLPLIFFQHAL